jgi:hypothetical protein
MGNVAGNWGNPKANALRLVSFDRSHRPHEAQAGTFERLAGCVSSSFVFGRDADRAAEAATHSGVERMNNVFYVIGVVVVVLFILGYFGLHA